MENAERLAREYRRALENAASGADVDRIVVLEENQLDLLNALLARAPLSPLDRRTLNYVKNVTFRILQKLNSLLKNDAYVPSFRNNALPCSSLLSTLRNLQIDIFLLYDRSNLSFSDLAEILSLENRKTALLAEL